MIIKDKSINNILDSLLIEEIDNKERIERVLHKHNFGRKIPVNRRFNLPKKLSNIVETRNIFSNLKFE